MPELLRGIPSYVPGDDMSLIEGIAIVGGSLLIALLAWWSSP